MNLVLGEQSLGFLALDTGMNDNVVTGLPIDRSSDSVLITQLDCVDYPYNLIEIPSCNGGVVQFEPDLFGGIDYEHCPDGKRETRSAINVGSILIIEHVVEVGNTTVTVGDDRILNIGFTVFIDIFDPLVVIVQVIRADTDNLDVPLFPITCLCASGDLTELGSAYRSKVSRMREEYTPRVSEKFMKLDGAEGGLSAEVRRHRAETQ